MYVDSAKLMLPVAAEACGIAVLGRCSWESFGAKQKWFAHPQQNFFGRIFNPLASHVPAAQDSDPRIRNKGAQPSKVGLRRVIMDLDC